jgi:2-oxoglutarate dehydrogenase complex dehydrogenase (E1) component-like enzyme
MAITTAVCNSYKKEILDGVHAAADTYKLALFTDSATLSATTTAYATTNEIVGAGYTAGGVTLAGFSTGLADGVAYLTFSDASWANATITARGCLIYNSSKSNKAVAAFDFGGNITSTSGTFTVDLPAAGATALIRIG